MSSKAVGARERTSERTWGFSSWKTPMVSPSCSILKVASSSSGMESMSTTTPRVRSTHSTVSVITSRLRSPKKSIFSRPRSSTPCISYWVTMGASDGSRPCSGLRCMGMYSVNGSGVMTTAAAWMPSWRRMPSMPRATSTTLATSASVSYIWRNSAAAT